MKTIMTVIGLLLVALVSQGCEGPFYPNCYEDRDCNSYEYCAVDNLCYNVPDGYYEGCYTDWDCYSDEYCGGDGYCYQYDSGHHDESAYLYDPAPVCPYGTILYEGECWEDDGCWYDSDCGYGYYCDVEDGYCYEDYSTDSGCWYDSDCGYGYYCGSDGYCYEDSPAEPEYTEPEPDDQSDDEANTPSSPCDEYWCDDAGQCYCEE